MNTVTIPKLASDAFPDPRPAPELCLLAAVMQMKLRDLGKRHYQAEARAFIESQDFEVFCEWL
jgi:hypothetical protein